MEDLEEKLRDIVKENKSLALAYKAAYEYIFSHEFKTIEERNLLMMYVRGLLLDTIE